MIITLMGADFSKSNIGTLSTWRISRSLGAGATYEGPTNIDKGAALSATVTLMESYEIGAAGVTVTMGGTVLSGAHSISGNVITITIAEVTGNVVIKVPTINTSTGEEDDPTRIEGKNLLTSWTEGYVVSDMATPKGDPYPLETGAYSDYVSVDVGTSYILDARGETTPFATLGYFYDANKIATTDDKIDKTKTTQLEANIFKFTAKKPYVRLNKRKNTYGFALIKESDYIKDAPENYVPVGEFIEAVKPQ